MRPRRAEAPSENLTLRVSPSERERLRRAAQANFSTVAEFARTAIMTAAEDTLEDDDRSTSH